MCQNKLKYNVIFIILIISFSCKENTPNELFEIESVSSLTIPAGLNTITTHIFTLPNITSSLQAQLANKNIKLSDLQSINPKDVQLTALTSNVEYSFLSDISVRYVELKDLNQKEIAFLDPVPFNAKSSIHLFPTLVDLKDFFKVDRYNLEIRIRLREFIPKSVDTRLDLRFAAR